MAVAYILFAALAHGAGDDMKAVVVTKLFGGGKTGGYSEGKVRDYAVKGKNCMANYLYLV